MSASRNPKPATPKNQFSRIVNQDDLPLAAFFNWGQLVAEFRELPPLSRAKRYRLLAQDARRQASTAVGALQVSYLMTAERWDGLAAELEGDITWVEQKSKRAT